MFAPRLGPQIRRRSLALSRAQDWAASSSLISSLTSKSWAVRSLIGVGAPRCTWTASWSSLALSQAPRLGRKFILDIESAMQVLRCKVTHQSWCAQAWAASWSSLALSQAPRLGRKFILRSESAQQVLGCKVTHQSWCAQTCAAHPSSLALSRAQDWVASSSMASSRPSKS